MSSSQTNFQPALLIQANAGTGKTFSLTNRFIWLLNQGESPDKILATTFTKKAAGEISERVFFRLAEAALDEAKSSGLADFLADPQFNSKRASELLTALVESQHRIQISTLDSFFYKLALSFTLELGLIPNWSVIDPELESEYITEAVRKVFQTSDFSLLIKLLKLIGRGKSKKSLTSAIKDLARSGFNLLRETENSGDVWGTIQRPALLETDKIAKSVDQLRKMPIPQTKAGVANKTWSNAVIAALLAIESNSWEDFLEKGIAKYILEGNDKFSRVEIEQNVRAVFQPLIRHATAVLIKVINDQTKSSKHLLELFQAEYLK
ncbi:MAG: UvrD-helicase domain-containing protein, partial [Bdellovibrionota bacterium]